MTKAITAKDARYIKLGTGNRLACRCVAHDPGRAIATPERHQDENLQAPLDHSRI